MRLGLRHKIILTNLVVLVITFIIVSALVTEGVYLVNKNALVQSLNQQAQVSVVTIRQSLLTGDDQLDAEAGYKMRAVEFATRISSDTGNRVLVFSGSGELLADSDKSNDFNSGLKELDEAYKGNRAYSERNYKGSRYICFAFPVMLSGKTTGAMVFFSPLDQIYDNKSNILVLFLISFAVGIMVILIVSILLSVRITKPIKELKQSALEIAHGDYKGKISIKSSDEVGELAGAFNVMSDEIENRINIINVEKNKLNSVLESMGEGVVAYNEKDEMIAVNGTAKGIISQLDPAETKRIIDKVKKDGIRTIVEVNMNEKYLLVCATPLSLDNSKTGVVLILNDVTELRLLQEKQRQFVTNVSHELKTPLTTILGYIDLLKTRRNDRDILEMSVNYLEGAAERLHRLVDDLIDLSCLSRYEFEIETRSVDIKNLVSDIVGQMSLKAQKYDIKINTHLPELGEIMADPTRIKQAVVNILDNAIKYSQKGNVEVVLSGDEEVVSLVIQDTGCGIPSDILQKIFEPFYRVDKARSREMGGNGLGLSITKEIIEKHGGKITIESNVGEGTKVSIILPRDAKF
jgi:signal transduction histidine kinase